MALMNYSTIFSSAGFAGESFDIAAGYNLSFSTVAGDLVFAAAGSTLTLSAGTFPTWIREVGKVFSTDSATNPGPFTVVSCDITNKILTVKEAVINETPAGVTVLDGSADALIISALLKGGNGVLTADAPLILSSTGALGAARTLSIAALEAETAQEGGEALRGRFFILSVHNSDISAVNSITVSSSATINGAGSFVIASASDYMFYHIANGAWRCSVMPSPAEAHATIARVPFTAAMWSAGASVNQIKIIPSGALGAGEAGPHLLKVASSYVVDVINTDLTPDEKVEVETQFDALGNVILVKAQKAKPFNGVAVIIGSLT